MEANDPTLVIIDVLEAWNVPYMIVGSHSSSFYGVPRSSLDADFVIELGSRSIAELEPFLPAGYHLNRQVEFETLTGSLKNVVHIDGTKFSIELFRLGSDPFHESRFSRRRKVAMHDRDVWMPTAEDVIVQKLRWARNKDLDDVSAVIATRGNILDWGYIHHWCAIHNTRPALETLRAAITT